MIWLWVALGSALGGVGRYTVSALAARWMGDTFPYGTLSVNVLGSFAIGLFAALVAPEGRLLVPTAARQFVMIGLCGGFTTFSGFSLETLRMLHDGEWWKAASNISLMLLLCFVAVWAGYGLGTHFNE